MMYRDLFEYVKKYLIENNGQFPQKVLCPFRPRSEHIRRVFMWANRLISGTDKPVNEKALLTAAVFHDVGYANLVEGDTHAANSDRIFRQFAASPEGPAGFSPDEIDFIGYLIANHSNKDLLKEKDTPLELILLMEADLLDETGALSIVWDCMAEGRRESATFEQSFEHMRNYSAKIISQNPMTTDTGKRYWKDKQKLVECFLDQLAVDIDIAREFPI